MLIGAALCWRRRSRLPPGSEAGILGASGHANVRFDEWSFDIKDQRNGPFGAGHVLRYTRQHIVTRFSTDQLEVWVSDVQVFVEDRPPSIKGGGNAGPNGRIESCPFDYDVMFHDSDPENRDSPRCEESLARRAQAGPPCLQGLARGAGNGKSR